MLHWLRARFVADLAGVFEYLFATEGKEEQQDKLDATRK
jgi:hypothetical protein